jgi:acetolactate synthase I/III small subunit
MMTTLWVEAEDKQGLLARVVMLFHRRAIVILSFSMTPAERPGAVRMVITVNADHAQAQRMVANLYKLVDVLSVQTALQKSPAETIRVTIN